MDIKAVKEKHRDFLLGLPNVTGVGIGKKSSGGQTTETLAIKVYVSRKVPANELSDEECVPELLEGFPTDVEVLGALRAN